MSLGWGVKLDLAKEMIDGVILRAEQMGNTDVLDQVTEDAEEFVREARSARSRVDAQNDRRGRKKPK